MVKNLLDQVIPFNDHLTTDISSDPFPSWIKDYDVNLLHANKVNTDAVVAAGGSGNYRTVMDAITGEPENNNKRYVIHVKTGVYVENMVIDKKKWNIMIIGDGMDATVISGSLSKVDHSKLHKSVQLTPTKETWPGVTKLCANLQGYPKSDPMDLSTIFDALEPAGLNFLTRMLFLDPRKRILDEDALKHAYFNDFNELDQVGY